MFEYKLSKEQVQTLLNVLEGASFRGRESAVAVLNLIQTLEKPLRPQPTIDGPTPWMPHDTKAVESKVEPKKK